LQSENKKVTNGRRSEGTCNAWRREKWIVYHQWTTNYIRNIKAPTTGPTCQTDERSKSKAEENNIGGGRCSYRKILRALKKHGTKKWERARKAP